MVVKLIIAFDGGLGFACHILPQGRDGGKIDFFDFLSIRLILSIIDKTLHLSIKNQFCLEERTNGGIGNRNCKKAKSVRFCICKKAELVSFHSRSPAYLLQICFWNFGFKIKIWNYGIVEL